MPLDSIGYAPTPADTKPATPCAKYLSRVLREGPEGPLWPRGFEWSYPDSSHCAIGLSRKLWGKFSTFDLDPWMAHRVFVSAEVPLGIYWGDVTPLHVADALDCALSDTALAAQVPA